MVASTSNLSTEYWSPTSGGLIVEWDKYSACDIPFGLPGGDTDSDGDCDSTDITQIQTWIDAPAYDVRGDINLDGSVNATDKSLAISNYQGTTSGWNVLSASVVANRIGYAGYQNDINLDLSHVRHRVYRSDLGVWTRRDPLGYVDGMGLYEYVASAPVGLADENGLSFGACGQSLACRSASANVYANSTQPAPPPPATSANCDPFASCKCVLPNPTYTPVPNGCTMVPDSFWLPGCRRTFFTTCCDAHDICYGTCRANKAACDLNLGACMANACFTSQTNRRCQNLCAAQAVIYHAGVAELGCRWFRAGQQDACICCDQPSPDPLCGQAALHLIGLCLRYMQQ